jgi:hypothetical protein
MIRAAKLGTDQSAGLSPNSQKVLWLLENTLKTGNDDLSLTHSQPLILSGRAKILHLVIGAGMTFIWFFLHLLSSSSLRSFSRCAVARYLVVSHSPWRSRDRPRRIFLDAVLDEASCLPRPSVRLAFGSWSGRIGDHLAAGVAGSVPSRGRLLLDVARRPASAANDLLDLDEARSALLQLNTLAVFARARLRPDRSPERSIALASAIANLYLP